MASPITLNSVILYFSKSPDKIPITANKRILTSGHKKSPQREGFTYFFQGLLDQGVSVCSCFFQDRGDAILIDGSQHLRRNFQSDPFVLFWNIESLCLKIWIKSSLRLVVCVRNVVPYSWSLTWNLTNFWHVQMVFWKTECKYRKNPMKDKGGCRFCERNEFNGGTTFQFCRYTINFSLKKKHLKTT